MDPLAYEPSPGDPGYEEAAKHGRTREQRQLRARDAELEQYQKALAKFVGRVALLEDSLRLIRQVISEEGVKQYIDRLLETEEHGG